MSGIGGRDLCAIGSPRAAVFNNPNSTILGVMSALYSLGSCASLPLVPYVTDKLGRRMAILVGSIIMIIGAILQMAAQDCKPSP